MKPSLTTQPDSLTRAALALLAAFVVILLALIEFVIWSPLSFRFSALFDVIGVLSICALLYGPALSFLSWPVLQYSRRFPRFFVGFGALLVLSGAAAIYGSQEALPHQLGLGSLYIGLIVLFISRMELTRPDRSFALVFGAHLLLAVGFLFHFFSSQGARVNPIRATTITRAASSLASLLLDGLNDGIKGFVDRPDAASLTELSNPDKTMTPGARPERVFLLTLDELSPASLEASSALQKLAASSTVWPRAVTPSSSSRAAARALLSGKQAFRTDEKSLAELFQARQQKSLAIIPATFQEGKEGARLTKGFDKIITEDKPLDALQKNLAATFVWIHLPSNEAAESALSQLLEARPANTLVIVTGLAGGTSKHRGADKDRSLYDEVIRVPLLFSWPQGAAQRADDPVSLLDVAPTIQALFGLDATDADGVNLFQAKPRTIFSSYSPRYIYVNASGVMTAIRGRWKLLFELTFQVAELYDLETDPNETNNLIDEHPEIATALTREILQELIQ
jgi:hypothetical protein